MRKLLYGLLTATLLCGGALAQEKKEDPKPAAKPDEKKPADPTPPAPAGTATSDYYPLTKGSKWTYTMGSTEVVVKVTDVDAKDGSAKLVTEHGGKQVASETILVKADGIYRTKINDTPIEGNVKILGLKDGKATKGEKWDVKAKVQASEVSGQFETKDVGQTVKVGPTEYKDVVYVEGPKFTIAGTDTAVKYSFAPKVGIIKLGYSIGGTESTPLELKSFEAGK